MINNIIRKHVEAINLLLKSKNDNPEEVKKHLKTILNIIVNSNLKFESILESVNELGYSELIELISLASKDDLKKYKYLLIKVCSVLINTRALNFKIKVEQKHFHGFEDTISIKERLIYRNILDDEQYTKVINETIKAYPNNDISKYENLIYTAIDNNYKPIEIRELIKDYTEDDLEKLFATALFLDNHKFAKKLHKAIEFKSRKFHNPQYYIKRVKKINK